MQLADVGSKATRKRQECYHHIIILHTYTANYMYMYRYVKVIQGFGRTVTVCC